MITTTHFKIFFNLLVIPEPVIICVISRLFEGYTSIVCAAQCSQIYASTNSVFANGI